MDVWLRLASSLGWAKRWMSCFVPNTQGSYDWERNWFRRTNHEINVDPRTLRAGGIAVARAFVI